MTRHTQRCRVTPKGCASVEGRTATKAWTALYDNQHSARALSFSGAKQFGLQHPRVQRMLQSLPEAAYCQSYAAWLGPAPPVPPLVTRPACSPKFGPTKMAPVSLKLMLPSSATPTSAALTSAASEPAAPALAAHACCHFYATQLDITPHLPEHFPPTPVVGPHPLHPTHPPLFSLDFFNTLLHLG